MVLLTLVTIRPRARSVCKLKSYTQKRKSFGVAEPYQFRQIGLICQGTRVPWSISRVPLRYFLEASIDVVTDVVTLMGKLFYVHLRRVIKQRRQRDDKSS